MITKAGFGPNYKYFAHRLGHGIGIDEHEQPYLVRGNRVILEPSMTFSDEPGIYVPGEYGLRCEDDMAISESGAGHSSLTPGLRPVARHAHRLAHSYLVGSAACSALQSSRRKPGISTNADFDLQNSTNRASAQNAFLAALRAK